MKNLYHFKLLFSLFIKGIVKKVPIKDPQIKFEPIIKLIGNLIDSFIKKLILLLLELFCMPIINKKNKQELKVIEKIILLNVRGIYLLL